MWNFVKRWVKQQNPENWWCHFHLSQLSCVGSERDVSRQISLQRFHMWQRKCCSRHFPLAKTATFYFFFTSMTIRKEKFQMPVNYLLFWLSENRLIYHRVKVRLLFIIHDILNWLFQARWKGTLISPVRRQIIFYLSSRVKRFSCSASLSCLFRWCSGLVWVKTSIWVQEKVLHQMFQI